MDWFASYSLFGVLYNCPLDSLLVDNSWPHRRWCEHLPSLPAEMVLHLLWALGSRTCSHVVYGHHPLFRLQLCVPLRLQRLRLKASYCLVFRRLRLHLLSPECFRQLDVTGCCCMFMPANQNLRFLQVNERPGRHWNVQRHLVLESMLA